MNRAMALASLCKEEEPGTVSFLQSQTEPVIYSLEDRPAVALEEAVQPLEGKILLEQHRSNGPYPNESIHH